MKRIVTALLGGALLLTLSATLAGAVPKYPPGPAYRSCPDTLTIFDTEQADTTIAPCHPAVGDTVLGLKGVVVGFDKRGGAYATFFTTPGGGNYTSIQAFTGATNYNGPVPGTPSGGNLALGDLIAVYGTMQEFPATNGTTEIEGPDVVQSTNDILIRRISTGNAVPMAILPSSQIHEINWLTAFSNGEKYENGLVRLRGPLKVGRNAGTGIQSPNYLVTCNTCGTDSVLVDAFTLDPAAPGAAPAVGTVIDSIQGIINQNTSSAGSGSINSYRLQVRDGNDVFLSVPPSLSDAYPIEDNKIRVVFDRNVDPATATNASNYSLASAIDGSVVNSAVMETTPGSVVILTITSVLSDGDAETVAAQNIGSAGCPSCLLTPAQNRSFVNGVLTARDLQTPDDAVLPSFDDRSRFAGAGTLAGSKFTYRAVAVHQYGSVYYTMDANRAIRGGVSVFAPTQPLVDGHAYRIAGQLQEFGGESEVINTAFITDEGNVGTPIPVTTTVEAVSDTTTDMAGSAGDPDGAILTGEDYECMLVTLFNVKVTENRAAGQSFFVAGSYPGYADTVLVSNLSGVLGSYTPPDSNSIVNVTGIVHFTSGTFRVCPRTPADIVEHGNNTGVGDGSLASVQFSVAPNPARVSTINFALPQHANVDLGIYDLAGRQVVSLAKGAMPAGTYTRKWNGTDSAGQRVNPGVYFYRLKVGSEVRNIRGVLLQ